MLLVLDLRNSPVSAKNSIWCPSLAFDLLPTTYLISMKAFEEGEGSYWGWICLPLSRHFNLINSDHIHSTPSVPCLQVLILFMPTHISSSLYSLSFPTITCPITCLGIFLCCFGLWPWGRGWAHRHWKWENEGSRVWKWSQIISLKLLSTVVWGRPEQNQN